MVSGEIEPLAKANSPPATPQTPPAMAKAEPVHALDVDADGLGAQRRIAPGAHGVAERREQKRAQQQHADRRERQRQQVSRRHACRTARVGQTPITPLEPPVTSSHWNTVAQTICAKASVSIAR